MTNPQIFRQTTSLVKKLGLEFVTEKSWMSESRYLTIYSPDGLQSFEIRFSGHELPNKYESKDLFVFTGRLSLLKGESNKYSIISRVLDHFKMQPPKWLADEIADFQKKQEEEWQAYFSDYQEEAAKVEARCDRNRKLQDEFLEKILKSEELDQHIKAGIHFADRKTKNHPNRNWDSNFYRGFADSFLNQYPKEERPMAGDLSQALFYNGEKLLTLAKNLK